MPVCGFRFDTDRQVIHFPGFRMLSDRNRFHPCRSVILQIAAVMAVDGYESESAVFHFPFQLLQLGHVHGVMVVGPACHVGDAAAILGYRGLAHLVFRIAHGDNTILFRE